MTGDIIDIQIAPDLRERIDSEIVRRVRAAVDCCKTRDQIFQLYGLQIDGLSQPFTQGPWNNSSQAEDMLTLEHAITHVSWLMAATIGKPRVMLDAKNPDDDDLAAQLESAFDAKLAQWAVDRMLYDQMYNAVCYPYAPCCVAWDQKIVNRRTLKEVDPATGLPVLPDDPQQQDIQTEEVPWSEPVVVHDGPKLDSIYPGDCYLYPPNAQDMDTCEGVMRRMYLSRFDLLTGIDKHQYEKDAVMELLKSGPTGYFEDNGDRYDPNRDQRDGTERDSREGVYECFFYQGRLPIMLDEITGNVETPKHLLEDDFEWMVCPGHSTCFMFHKAPYTFRAFDSANIMRYPGRILGRCVPQILEVLQEEATALLRTKINIAEFDSNPIIRKPESMRQDSDAREVYPGAEWFYRGMNPDVISPMVWPVNSITFLIQSIADLRKRADDVLGAGSGITQIGTQETTATEVNTVAANATMRRDLFLQTFLTFLARFYKRVFQLWMMHMPEDGEDVMVDTGTAVHVDKADIAEKFVFTPNSNTAAGNPQMRLAMTKAKQAVQLGYFQSIMLMPQYAAELYHGARRQLSEMGERSIEQWIGREPTDMEIQALVMQQQMQQAGQGSQTQPSIQQSGGDQAGIPSPSTPLLPALNGVGGGIGA